MGQLAAKAAGVPDVPLVEYPGAVGVDHAEIRDKIENVLFEKIINALTKPVESKAPGAVYVQSVLSRANPCGVDCRLDLRIQGMAGRIR